VVIDATHGESSSVHLADFTVQNKHGSYCRTSLSEVGGGDISTPDTLEFLKEDDVQ